MISCLTCSWTGTEDELRLKTYHNGGDDTVCPKCGGGQYEEINQMEKILPVITLYQPWATWIMRGWKTIETRTHNRFGSLLGKTILIHAGLKTDDSNLTVNNPYLTKAQILHNPDEVINGHILGSCHVARFGLLSEIHETRALIECRSVNRFGLYLTDIKKFDNPILCKGEMGIWYFDLVRMTKIKKAHANSNP